jgi:hypothetical protein
VENHNKRKCTSNPDVVREHPKKNQASKSAWKKKDKAAADKVCTK